MTVDAWFEYWTGNIKGQSVRDNTKRNYLERYEKNIKPEAKDFSDDFGAFQYRNYHESVCPRNGCWKRNAKHQGYD